MKIEDSDLQLNSSMWRETVKKIREKERLRRIQIAARSEAAEEKTWTLFKAKRRERERKWRERRGNEILEL